MFHSWGFFLFQINEFVKRARAAKIHAYIISHLKNEMPSMIGKAKTQQRLIDNLDTEFNKVSNPSIGIPFLITLEVHLHNHVICNRYKRSIIYLLVTSQMLNNSGRPWVATASTSLRDWSQKWYKLLMTC